MFLIYSYSKLYASFLLFIPWNGITQLPEVPTVFFSLRLLLGRNRRNRRQFCRCFFFNLLFKRTISSGSMYLYFHHGYSTLVLLTICSSSKTASFAVLSIKLLGTLVLLNNLNTGATPLAALSGARADGAGGPGCVATGTCRRCFWPRQVGWCSRL